MQIIATNIGKPTPIIWNGEEQYTGIFKYPVEEAVKLEQEAVQHDTVADRRVHGGIHKACYLFSAEQYPYWKGLYPGLSWNWGMFGENLTVKGLDEAQIRIGNIYSIGSSVVQISQPREPCFKLGIRFGTQEILKQFIDRGYPGTYVRILEAGKVVRGDEVVLLETSENSLTVQLFYTLLNTRNKDPKIVQLAINNMALPGDKREKLKKFLT